MLLAYLKEEERKNPDNLPFDKEKLEELLRNNQLQPQIENDF